MNGGSYYSCDSLVNEYWLDVRRIVFSECDYKWPSTMWAEYSHSCKSGAEQFAIEKIGECFDVQDCSDLGAAGRLSWD